MLQNSPAHQQITFGVSHDLEVYLIFIFFFFSSFFTFTFSLAVSHILNDFYYLLMHFYFENWKLCHIDWDGGIHSGWLHPYYLLCNSLIIVYYYLNDPELFPIWEKNRKKKK